MNFKIGIQNLTNIVKNECSDRWNGSIHGNRHWYRVISNGKRIAAHTPGVDAEVCEVFGLIHDCQRLNDGYDPEHGYRAAEFAVEHRNDVPLNDDQFETLVFALTNHTGMIHHSDPTVGACFDSDRLDLGRVGITPNPEYLNTEFAKEQTETMMQDGDYDEED